MYTTLHLRSIWNLDFRFLGLSSLDRPGISVPFELFLHRSLLRVSASESMTFSLENDNLALRALWV